MKIFCWCQSLIQFYVNGQGCVSSLLFDQRPNYGGGNENNGDLLQKVPCTHCYTQWPQLCSRPPPTNASTRDSWTFTGTLVSLLCVNCSFLLGPGVPKVLFVPSKSLFESAALNMPANLENSAVATGLEKVSFNSNPKERQCQRMHKLPHNCTHLTRY